MPAYTIEATYRLSAYRHRTYHADTLEQACRLAIEDNDWTDEKLDRGAAGETYVGAIWCGIDTAYSGERLPVPSQFGDEVQRKARHFETLLGLLKILAANGQAGRPTPDLWLERATFAIAKAQAILAGGRDPDRPADLPAPPHVLAELHENRVRELIPDVVATDPEFANLDPNAVTHADIRAACASVAASVNLSDETGAAEFRAAIVALRMEVARKDREGGGA